MDAVEVAARDRQVTGDGGAAGENDRVVPFAKLVGGDVDAHVDTGAETGAPLAHLLQPQVEMTLLHLELGDAVAQQPADPVRTLKDDDRVAGAGELLRGSETG